MSLRKGSNLIAGTQDVAQQLIATGSAGSANPVSSVAVNAALSVRDAEIAELGEVKVPLVGKGINLLDNWYFPNPVNQRGQNSYNTNGAYSIDRWKFYTSAAAPVYVLSTGLKPDATAISSGAPYLEQIVEDYNCIPGKTYTFSALAVDGTDTSAAIWYLRVQATVNGTLQNLAASINTELGLKSITFTIPSGASVLRVHIGVYTGRFVTVSAAKLELGDTQTLARNIGTEANPQWVLNDPAPNYQQELAKCQRYLLVLNPDGKAYAIVGTGDAATATEAHFWAPVPNPIRLTSNQPIMTYTGNWRICDSVPGTGVRKGVTGMSLELGASCASMVMIKATVASGLTVGGFYELQASNDVAARIIISSEL